MPLTGLAEKGSAAWVGGRGVFDMESPGGELLPSKGFCTSTPPTPLQGCSSSGWSQPESVYLLKRLTTRSSFLGQVRTRSQR